MTFKKIAITVAICWLSTTWGGGIGGFDGGSSSDIINSKDGPLLFQDHSLFVNPHFNRTVCLTSQDKYRADVTRVIDLTLGDDDDSQKEIIKERIFQPRISLKEKCMRRDKDSGNCIDSVWARYIQPRDRIIDIRDGHGDLIERVRVRIPNCR